MTQTRRPHFFFGALPAFLVVAPGVNRRKNATKACKLRVDNAFLYTGIVFIPSANGSVAECAILRRK